MSSFAFLPKRKALSRGKFTKKGVHFKNESILILMIFTGTKNIILKITRISIKKQIVIV